MTHFKSFHGIHQEQMYKNPDSDFIPFHIPFVIFLNENCNIFQINNDMNLLPGVTLGMRWNDTRGKTVVATRVITDMLCDDVVAFFGPEGPCYVEAIVAQARNLPMISYVSILRQCLPSRSSMNHEHLYQFASSSQPSFTLYLERSVPEAQARLPLLHLPTKSGHSVP